MLAGNFLAKDNALVEKNVSTSVRGKAFSVLVESPFCFTGRYFIGVLVRFERTREKM